MTDLRNVFLVHTEFICTIIQAAFLCMMMQCSVPCRLSLLPRSSFEHASHTCMRTAYTCAFGDTKSGALPDFQRLPWQSKAAVYGLVPS